MEGRYVSRQNCVKTAAMLLVKISLGKWKTSEVRQAYTRSITEIQNNFLSPIGESVADIKRFFGGGGVDDAWLARRSLFWRSGRRRNRIAQN